MNDVIRALEAADTYLIERPWIFALTVLAGLALMGIQRRR
jgi:hypothetical protein